MRQNPYYNWSLFDLLDEIKSSESKLKKYDTLIGSMGLMSVHDRTQRDLLKAKLALMNAELNDKTK